MRGPSEVLPAVVLVTECTVVACSTSPRGTEAERAADADTAARVEAALAEDPNLYARHARRCPAGTTGGTAQRSNYGYRSITGSGYRVYFPSSTLTQGASCVAPDALVSGHIVARPRILTVQPTCAALRSV
jgi:hypothetical protein